MKKKLAAYAFAAFFGLAASDANAVVINFIGGTPSDTLNGGSLVTTPGTVGIGEVASYVSGGTGLTGQANVWPNAATPSAAASEIGNHLWLQGDPQILFLFTQSVNQVVAVPGIDHGPIPGEALEWVVWGSNSVGGLLEEGAINQIFDDGVDGAAGIVGASDDFTSIWQFNSAYNYFVVKSGTHCTNSGCYSPGEFEIDGLATVVPIPAALPLFGTGLAVMGFFGWRRRRKAVLAS